MHLTEQPLVAKPTLPRAALLARLEEVLASKLTLVIAPPGYGKTELLNQWHAALSGRASVVRLDLEFEHNHPEQFRSAIVAAAAQHLPLVEDTGGQVAPTDLTGFLEAVAARNPSEPQLVFMLDNLDCIVESVVLDVLSSALGLLPPRTAVIIASREKPNFFLSELRARGELVEISEQDLSLSQHEFDELWPHRGLASAASELGERTLGWPAVAALAVGSLHGSTTALDEYFDEVVLAGLTPDEVSFLEETAFLAELTPQSMVMVRRPAADHAALIDRLTDVGRVPLLRRGAERWVVPPELRRHLMARLARRDPARFERARSRSAELAGYAPLSAREREVLELLADGCTVAEIATELVVSFHTAKTHVRSVYAKLGVSTRVLALQRARELELV